MTMKENFNLLLANDDEEEDMEDYYSISTPFQWLIKSFFLGKFSQICEATQPPQGFCEI